MNLHFLEIKKQFFPMWDRQNQWRFTSRSRRKVEGRCDPERRVIEIVTQHADQDEADRLLIHEICHAVAAGGHGKVWQRRMEMAARRADELGRHRLGELLREEIAKYQEEAEGIKEAYQEIRDLVEHEPDVTLAQVKRFLANHYKLLVSEISKNFRRTEKVFQEAKREAQAARAVTKAAKERFRDSQNNV